MTLHGAGARGVLEVGLSRRDGQHCGRVVACLCALSGLAARPPQLPPCGVLVPGRGERATICPLAGGVGGRSGRVLEGMIWSYGNSLFATARRQF